MALPLTSFPGDQAVDFHQGQALGFGHLAAGFVFRQR